jgi:hypothetical protein
MIVLHQNVMRFEIVAAGDTQTPGYNQSSIRVFRRGALKKRRERFRGLDNAAQGPAST